jgi:hypothetical protein
MILLELLESLGGAFNPLYVSWNCMLFTYSVFVRFDEMKNVCVQCLILCYHNNICHPVITGEEDIRKH